MIYSKTQRLPRQGTPETSLKWVIRQYLGFKGWFTFPILQGLGAYKGIPDIIACKDGKVLFIEVKAPKGKQSPHQIEFERRITAQGCQYILVKSLDDVISVLSDLNM